MISLARWNNACHVSKRKCAEHGLPEYYSVAESLVETVASQLFWIKDDL